MGFKLCSLSIFLNFKRRTVKSLTRISGIILSFTLNFLITKSHTIVRVIKDAGLLVSTVVVAVIHYKLLVSDTKNPESDVAIETIVSELEQVKQVFAVFAADDDVDRVFEENHEIFVILI